MVRFIGHGVVTSLQTRARLKWTIEFPACVSLLTSGTDREHGNATGKMVREHRFRLHRYGKNHRASAAAVKARPRHRSFDISPVCCRPPCSRCRYTFTDRQVGGVRRPSVCVYTGYTTCRYGRRVWPRRVRTTIS